MPTPLGAPTPSHVFQRGDKVQLARGRERARGEVVLASRDGVSLAVEFRDAMFAGYVELIPLYWDGGHFVDITYGRTIGVVLAPSQDRRL